MKSEKKSRRWGLALGILVAPYAAYVLVLSLLAPILIYPFADRPFAHSAFENRALERSDGSTLPIGVADLGPGSPVLLFFHGNTGTRSDFSTSYDTYLQAGFSVVAMTYQGAEGDVGAPSETALKADGLRVFDALPELLGREPGEVHLMGYSLGTGIAAQVAADRRAASLVLVAPYGRLCRVAGQKVWAPACLIPWVPDWNTEALAPRISEPILVVHGIRDDLIPAREGVRLATALAADDTEKGTKTRAVFVPFIGHWILPAASRPVLAWLGGGFVSGAGMSAAEIAVAHSEAARLDVGVTR